MRERSRIEGPAESEGEAEGLVDNDGPAVPVGCSLGTALIDGEGDWWALGKEETDGVSDGAQLWDGEGVVLGG